MPIAGPISTIRWRNKIMTEQELTAAAQQQPEELQRKQPVVFFLVREAD